jgi:hypothetical protein
MHEAVSAQIAGACGLKPLSSDLEELQRFGFLSKRANSRRECYRQRSSGIRV